MNQFISRNATSDTKFAILNVIMTDWRPLLGSHGFDIYACLVMLATTRQNIGLRRIGGHLGITERSVRHHLQFLYLCELIDIALGDATNPNTISIIDPPQLNNEFVDELREIVVADELLGNPAAAYFTSAVLKRIDNWAPLSTAPETTTKVTGDPALVTDLTTRLTNLGVGDDQAAEWITKYNGNLTGWVEWVEWKQQDDPKYFKKSVAGFLARVLGRGQHPLPVPAANPVDEQRRRDLFRDLDSVVKR